MTFLVLVCCLAELEDALGVGVADDFGVGVLDVLVGVVRDETVEVVDFLDLGLKNKFQKKMETGFQVGFDEKVGEK